MRRNSPFTGWPSIFSAIFWERSPSATASMTRATSVVGRARSSIREFTESRLVPQAPGALKVMRSVIRPSRPMTRDTRTSSFAMRALVSAIWLYTAAISPMTEPRRAGSRTEKSPSRAAVRARSSSWRAWALGAAPLPPPLVVARVLVGVAEGHFRRCRDAVVQLDPSPEPAHIGGGRAAVDLGQILLVDAEGGVGQSLGQVAVVGQEQQTLGFGIEAADREDPWLIRHEL